MAKKAKRDYSAFREMAAQLQGELNEGKHQERLKQAETLGLERYSPLNQLLILSQWPDVTEVHGYVEWQRLGFQVRKGGKSIAIRAPHTVQTEDGDSKVGFHFTTVFDRSQVDPVQQNGELEPDTTMMAADQ